MPKPQSQSQTKKFPIQNFAIIIVAFLLIGVMLGPNAGQVYTGTSVTGADTVELTNNGNLDTKVRDYSLEVGVALPATGGTITRDGDYYVHTFTSNGTFTPSVAMNADVLVVAGGGAGAPNAGAGGGGGGVQKETGFSVSATSYSVTVGVGGEKGVREGSGDTANGQSGSNSIFSTITSIGGGGGGSFNAVLSGYDGGSGGGARPGTGDTTGGVGTVGQGYAGGNAFDYLSGWGPGGGGGASAAGSDGTNTGLGGDGGDGVADLITGSSVLYGGGGGGGGDTAGSGGLGGGGDGASGANTATTGTDGLGGGGGGARCTPASQGNAGDGGDGVVIVRYLLPSVSAIDPGISVGDDKLYYDGTLSSTLMYSDGSAYIDSSDVSASMKGSLPIIKVGTTQNIKIDHSLQYSITYIPKNMDVSSPNMFNAGEDLTVNTRLTDTSGNPVSNQPLEMRARLFDSEDNRYLDEIISSTSFVIPGKYIKSGKHYQLRLSYEGYEFGGWSNEILADFDVGTEGFTITSSPDKAPEGVMAASIAAASNMVGLAVTGWLDSPIIGDIIKFITDLIGVML